MLRINDVFAFTADSRVAPNVSVFSRLHTTTKAPEFSNGAMGQAALPNLQKALQQCGREAASGSGDALDKRQKQQCGWSVNHS